MALKQYQATYGGRDLKIGALLSDPEGGGSATLGPKVDASAIQDFNYTVTFKVIELKGDDKTRAVKVVIDKIEGSFKLGKGNFELDEILLGGTPSAVSGASPHQTQSYVQKGAQAGKYFEAEFQEMDMEEDNTGDLHTTLHKCRVTSKENASTQDSAKETTYNFTAIPRDCDDYLYTQVKNETAVNIVTSTDSVAPTISAQAYADGATVPTNAVFTYTFSEPLDPRSVSSETVFLQNKATGTIIAVGANLLSADGLTITVAPTSALASATAHQVFLSKALTDLARNKMGVHALYDYTTS